jgi:hypothetical protein
MVVHAPLDVILKSNIRGNMVEGGHELMKISYPNLMIVAATISRKNIRINLFPFKIANRAPSKEPKKLQNAIGIA